MSFKNALVGDGFKVPPNYDHLPTSDLLTNGLVADLPYPGMPSYSPIGAPVLHSIERQLQTALSNCGYVQVELPSLVSDSDLHAGDSVGPQFASKLLAVSNLPGYHLLSTPEMLFTRLFRTKLRSYRDLPLRRSYTASFFRRAPAMKALLICRQFRIVGIAAMELDSVGVLASLNAAVDACTAVLSSLGVETVHLNGGEAARLEMCYPTTEGDIWIGSAENRSRALSLGIGYEYASGSRLPIRYRNAANRNSSPRMATFGLCSNRALHCVFDACRDQWGFALPRSVKPYDAVVIPRGTSSATRAVRVSAELQSAGLRVGLDDRYSMATTVRQSFAHYIGADAAIVVAEDDVRWDACRGRSRDGEAARLDGLVDTIVDRN